jgi:3-oxoacyl-[acyl-carrier protein] reductase
VTLPALSLQGRTALVTGAATGIGRATALLFARAGARVVVNHWRQANEAQALVAQILAADGDALAHEADVSDAAAVQAMADAAGAVDVLVNNAGIIQEKAFLDTTEADWDRMMAVDLKAVFLVCRAVIPGMLSKGQGAIVNIASDLGILGRERYAPYCAAKAGVIGLTKSLAREFAPQHIRPARWPPPWSRLNT